MYDDGADNNKDPFDCPPDPEKRNFNENDILGDFERDTDASVIIPRHKKDKMGEKSNPLGYLVNPNGDILNNRDKGVMFEKDKLNDNDELPAPFGVEKFNFNPIRALGNLDYFRNGEPKIKELPNGMKTDKKGDPVTEKGWRIDENDNMIDNNGHKKFDKSQILDNGDLPNLFNYDGKPFDIKDVIGQVEKDDKGNMVNQVDKRGALLDKLGRPINPKGYLVDQEGNVIDKNGDIMFEP